VELRDPIIQFLAPAFFIPFVSHFLFPALSVPLVFFVVLHQPKRRQNDLPPVKVEETTVITKGCQTLNYPPTSL